ncbi:MAG: hypothetical protein GOV15_03205, partial [Candidatus Diapherotrites archaeon]|nr:hypothetical protein [Candidatus Diapherotrites archaeon]
MASETNAILTSDCSFGSLKLEGDKLYFDEGELNDVLAVISKKIKDDPSFITFFINKTYDRINEILEVTKKASQGVESSSNRELKENFEAHLNSGIRFAPIINIPNFLELIMTKSLKAQIKNAFPSVSEEAVNEYFVVLSTPKKETAMAKEFKECLELATKLKRGGDINKLLKDHVGKWSWLGVAGKWSYLAEPWGEGVF